MSENTAIQTHSWITADHLRRLAVIYVRQSTEKQVRENTGSTQFQRDLARSRSLVRLAGISDRDYR